MQERILCRHQEIWPQVILRTDLIRLWFYKMYEVHFHSWINPCDTLFNVMNQLPINILANSISEHWWVPPFSYTDQFSAAWEKERKVWGLNGVSCTLCTSLRIMLQKYLLIPCPVLFTPSFLTFPITMCFLKERCGFINSCHKFNNTQSGDHASKQQS